MAASPILLLCILVTCSGRLQQLLHQPSALKSSFEVMFDYLSSVWTVQARNIQVRTDYDEDDDSGNGDQVELSIEAGRVCD